MELSGLEQALVQAGLKHLAGCDEAGRGALAGPVAAAAVVLDYRNLPAVIMDSKRLTRRRRELAAAEIKEKALAYATYLVEPREIERINILQASLSAMAHAVAKLGMPVDCVLADGNQLPPVEATQVHAIVGGDAKILCIAAASILAKVERDFLMQQYARQGQYKRYGFDKHMGYGTAAHLAALKRYGPCALHRRTFKPVRDLASPTLFDG